MQLKGEFGASALNSHGNNIFDHGKARKNHGIVFLNFCGNPDETLPIKVFNNVFEDLAKNASEGDGSVV